MLKLKIGTKVVARQDSHAGAYSPVGRWFKKGAKGKVVAFEHRPYGEIAQFENHLIQFENGEKWWVIDQDIKVLKPATNGRKAPGKKK